MLEAIGKIIQQVLIKEEQTRQALDLILEIPFDIPLIITQHGNNLVVQVNTLSSKSLECILYASEFDCIKCEKEINRTKFYVTIIKINTIIEWRLLDKALLDNTSNFAIKTPDYNKLLESRL